MAKDETEVDPAPILNWDGADDAENPRNFSKTRKVFSTITVTFLAFVSTLAASIYSPGHQDVAEEFSVSTEVSFLPLSLFNLGMALGPLIGAPLSETYGRRIVFLVTTPIFALFTLGAALSTNITSLTICRFLAGVLAAPAISNASATIVDYTAPQYRALSLSFYYSIPSFGAMAG